MNNQPYPPGLFRNCTPFALRALPSVGGSLRCEKKKLKSNLSWTYIGSPCSEAGFLDSDGYHRTSVIRFSFTVNVFKSPSIISVLNDFGRFWPAQRGGSSLSLYWRWWRECSSWAIARLYGFAFDLALEGKVPDLKFWCRADELQLLGQSPVVWFLKVQFLRRPVERV